MYKSIIKNLKCIKIYAHTYRLYLAPSIRLDYHRAIRSVLFIISVWMYRLRLYQCINGWLFSCGPTLCDSMGCSMPGSSVLHYLPEFTQIHFHWVGDAIQPSHPLSPPSPFPFSLSQHQSLFPISQLFTTGGQSIGASASASVLPMNVQGWFPLGLTCLISLKFKGLSRVFFSTTVWKHQFFGAQPSLWSNSHIHTWLLEKS